MNELFPYILHSELRTLPAREISMDEAILLEESHSISNLDGVLEKSSHSDFTDECRVRGLRLQRGSILLQMIPQRSERCQFGDHHQG